MLPSRGSNNTDTWTIHDVADNRPIPRPDKCEDLSGGVSISTSN